jgi:WXG100 family type VII secretion target
MTDPTGAQLQVTDDLQSAGGNLNGRADTIRDQLVALKAKVTDLQSVWDSPAAREYYEHQQNDWDIAADGLFGPTGVLGQVASALNLSWNNYTDAEQSNLNTWKGTGGSAPN